MCAGLAGALVLVLTGVVPGAGGTPPAAGQAGSVGEPYIHTDDSVPAEDVTMIGATPEEVGAGKYETWGVGRGAPGALLVRYTRESGWTLAPGLENEAGQPLEGFELDTPVAFSSHSGPSTFAGQMTEDGAGVLVGNASEGEGAKKVESQVVLVREPDDPANPFREVKTVPEEDLAAGERLFGLDRAPLIAALDEAGGHAGALVVPVREHSSSSEEQVLHWSGEKQEWTSEKIELPISATEFRVLAIGASSPSNAWLLAQVSSEGVALLRRVSVGSEETWKPVALKPKGEPGEPLGVKLEGGAEEEPLTVPGAERERVLTQVLTVTSAGIWIDGERPRVKASTTLYFQPNGEEGGELTSWCALEASPAGTKACEHPLPEALPAGASRSIAWAGPGFGQRVITGFPEGVSLRLEGTSEFTKVLGLGGSGSHDQGGTYGAAFSNPKEGWLGNFDLPVHVTGEPEPTRLAPWPVPFRHALLAVAPQPGAPVGALSSEVLAVGDLGEVVRYKPGRGWLPESLFGAGERRETPRLRAVAWPTPNRAYAVGDRNAQSGLGQMWLWRGETGLWEPDPAAPYNFDGNLLGIAFEAGNPARGYAVGEDGVLLGYGKTWTQESYPEESPCPKSTSARCTWANASFTSVAFAGSEAIVAYRLLPETTSERYEGGLIVNNGSGWHIDKAAAAVMAANVPWAVAGLPDGGAAFGASRMIYEREGAGAPWQATPTPFPAGGAPGPGSLELFREGSALRVIAAGSVPDTYKVEAVTEAPPGSPPVLLEPYPLATNAERGVLRQTADGWSDEEHELNNAQEPEGNWTDYDEVYQPDPVAALLVDPTGAQGWAVGGFVEPEDHEGVLDTADVDRYPAEGASPPGAGSAPLSTEPAKHAIFAIGGNAQCAAPCADRANARIGPDAWLENALYRAGEDVSGARAFLYTGPRLVDPHATNGPKEAVDRIDYEAELGRYAQILGAGGVLPAFVAGTPTDLDEAGSEGAFESAFGGPSFAQPLGGSSQARANLSVLGKAASACGETPECQSAYYALESNGSAGSVRVIVLDDTAEMQPTQLQWLEGQLTAAMEAKKPAIVVGNADLNAEVAAGGTQGANATQVERVLAGGGAHVAEASAYFFDAPEKNVYEPLAEPSGSGKREIPTFGSGTLGYVKFQSELSEAFVGASGFLLGEVEPEPAIRKSGNRAPVSARLIPNVGELALEAQGGTLLRRSNTALFAALARRPRAGNRSAAGGSPAPETNLYVPIASSCVGAACENGLFPQFTLTSSNAQIGGFVKQDFAVEPKGHEPLFNAKGEPELEPVNSKGESVSTKSNLFCAFNPGQTTVTISAGGLSSSLTVQVQPGSVRQPCGTVPLSKAPAAQQQATPPVPPPAPAPAPAAAGPGLTPVPLPVPPAAVVPSPVRPAPPAPPFYLPSGLGSPLLAVVPPPVPTPARPTPPSGTSAVTSPVEAPEKEEETEAAPESVSNEAVAYRAHEHDPAPAFILGIVILAAFAGASTRRRPRRGRREARVAPATISTMRSQQRIDDTRGGRRRY